MGYSIDPISADCYPGTTVLINKFDIRSEEKLRDVESVIVAARYANLMIATIQSAQGVTDLLTRLFPENILYEI